MFKTSLTLGRVWGIPLRLHVSMLFIVPFIAWSVVTHELRPAMAAIGLGLGQLVLPHWLLGTIVAISLFAAVALHELGHALVALRQGGRVKQITLMLLGGMAEIDHEQATPKQQAWMAFAGPLVSLVLGIVGFLLARIPGLMPDVQVIFALFGAINVSLFIFNMIPAFPLDGGRILKALLQMVTTQERAVAMAAGLGKMLAVAALAFAVVKQQPMLFLIALFVFVGAGAEQAWTQAKSALSGLRARQAMVTRVASVEPERPLHAVARHMLFQSAQATLVRDVRRTYGVLVPRDLRRGKGNAGEALKGVPLIVQADDDLAVVATALQKSGQGGAIVIDDFNTVIGVVTHEEIARTLALKSAAEAGRPPQPRTGQPVECRSEAPRP